MRELGLLVRVARLLDGPQRERERLARATQVEEDVARETAEPCPGPRRLDIRELVDETVALSRLTIRGTQRSHADQHACTA